MKIKVNPDKDFVKEMRNSLKDNNGYCPCSPFKNEDTKCMCKNFREQTETGYCHCGLYYKE
jgi:ferredoxin-thioredoxin reductase catalytic subunit